MVSGKKIALLLISFHEAGVSKSSCCLRRCLTACKSSLTWARMLVNLAEPSHLLMNSSSIFRYFYENITSRYYRD